MTELKAEPGDAILSTGSGRVLLNIKGTLYPFGGSSTGGSDVDIGSEYTEVSIEWFTEVENERKTLLTASASNRLVIIHWGILVPQNENTQAKLDFIFGSVVIGPVLVTKTGTEHESIDGDTTIILPKGQKLEARNSAKGEVEVDTLYVLTLGT